MDAAGILTQYIRTSRGRPIHSAARDYYQPAARIVCADGFSMSVQAGEGLYSEPRNNDGPWTKFEIGYPTECENLFMPYCEDPDRPTDTVYGYVPAEVIMTVIEAHGGTGQFLTL